MGSSGRLHSLEDLLSTAIRVAAREWRLIGLAFALVASFMVLMTFALRPQLADEGVYFYAALRVAQGALPNRDFFFAHPPFHLLPTALLFYLIGGYSLFAAKLTVFACGAVQIVAVMYVVARQFRAQAAITGGVVAAGSLVALSEGFLRLSCYDTGVVQATSLAVLSLALQLEGRSKLAGVCAGLAASCAPQLLLLSLSIGALAEWRKSYWLAFGACVALAGAAWLGVCGTAAITQSFNYHFAKVSPSGHAKRQVLSFLVVCWPLILTGVIVGVLPLVNAARRQLRRRLLLVCVAHVVVVGNFTVPFGHYFLPVLPLLALIAGLGIGEVIEGRDHCGSRPAWVRAAPVAVALFALLAPSPMTSELASMRGPWSDAPGIGPLNSVVQAAFWRSDGVAIGPISRYLWVQSCWLDPTAQVVAAIRADSPAREPTILGDSVLTPSVALVGGFRILDDLIDTNSQRFSADPSLASEMEHRLAGSPSTYVLTTDAGLGKTFALRRYVTQTRPLLAKFTSTCGLKYSLFGPVR